MEAEAETLADAPSPPYFTGEPRLAYFRRTGFTRDQWKGLKAQCEKAGVTFLSSPFSLEAVDLLEAVGVGAYKIPSGEVSNLPLLERVAATGKSTLLSSGMSDWAELDAAVAILKRGGSLTILQCTSAYPCPPERVGLNVLGEMRARYGLPVGFSDHTNGPAAALAAAALGAVAVFSRLAAGLREVWAMNAHPVDKNDLAPYRDMKAIFEKSIVTARAMAAGAVLTSADLAFKKPGDGIPAARYAEIVGRKLRRAAPADHKLAWDDLA
ncbi:MAG: N-acetylneuraminate synthase family protein [Proteobacteria bacterium]|nr:N-acetylneuraminate synthase family protein [Pseudomonadota bacterium]